MQIVYAIAMAALFSGASNAFSAALPKKVAIPRRSVTEFSPQTEARQKEAWLKRMVLGSRPEKKRENEQLAEKILQAQEHVDVQIKKALEEQARNFEQERKRLLEDHKKMQESLRCLGLQLQATQAQHAQAQQAEEDHKVLVELKKLQEATNQKVDLQLHVARDLYEQAQQKHEQEKRALVAELNAFKEGRKILPGGYVSISKADFLEFLTLKAIMSQSVEELVKEGKLPSFDQEGSQHRALLEEYRRQTESFPSLPDFDNDSKEQ